MKPYWATDLDAATPFSFERVYRFPEAELCDARVAHSGGGSVGIIGAGIAGLAAAYELTEMGFNVTVFEEAERVGGRLRTVFFDDGSHAELGAMRIPGNHACALHYCQQFGLPLRPFVNYNPDAFYLLRGQLRRIAEYRTAGESYQLAGAELGRDPSRVLEQAMEGAMARLSSTEKFQLFHSWTPGIIDEYDRRTLRQHLEAELLSSEAIEYIGHATGLLQYEQASFLETLVDYFGLLRVDQFELVDGMEKLVLAFARRLSERIHLNAPVKSVAIDQEGTHFTILQPDGTSRTFDCDFALCTVPARPTARITWTPELSYRKLEACRRLHYASATKTILNVSERTWELDQRIFGGGSFSDEPFQQCWYPSDNAVAVDGQLHAVMTGNDEEDIATSSAAASWTARSEQKARSGAALTASYTWETNARAMAGLAEDERTALVLRSLERLHPGISNVVRDVRHIVWDDETRAGGAFAYFAPGEHGRYLEPLMEPHPASNPRVFFGGEHVSVVHAWIQGAIQSSLQAVLDIAASSADLHPSSLLTHAEAENR